MAQPFSEEEIVNFLYGLRLGKYETEAYLTLIKHGPQNYKGLDELCSVPYGKIYYTLKTLDNKGWVKTVNRRPKIFYAVDPEIPLTNELNRIRNMVNELEESFQRIAPQLKTLYILSHKTSAI
jgi:sugar-specific transcriptional regulator TrmB